MQAQKKCKVFRLAGHKVRSAPLSTGPINFEFHRWPPDQCAFIEKKNSRCHFCCCENCNQPSVCVTHCGCIKISPAGANHCITNSFSSTPSMHLNKSPAFMQLSLKLKCVSIKFFWGWNFFQNLSHLGSPTATPHFWKECAAPTWKVTLIFLIYLSFIFLSFHNIISPWFALKSIYSLIFSYHH